MNGKIVAVTGANSGIGYAFCEAMVRRGARVVMVCRNPDRGEAARASLVRSTGRSGIGLLQCDLLSPTSILNFSRRFKAQYEGLDVLFNNAGSLFWERELTAEGVERNFMVYFLGHKLLTDALLDPLKKAGGHVLNMVGKYALKGEIDWDDLQLERGFSGPKAGANTQLMKLMWTLEIAEQWKSMGIRVNAYHPGAVRTGMIQKLPWYLRIPAVPLSWFFRNPQQGVETAIRMVESRESGQATGQFLFDHEPLPIPAIARDSTARKRLLAYAASLLPPQ